MKLNRIILLISLILLLMAIAIFLVKKPNISDIVFIKDFSMIGLVNTFILIWRLYGKYKEIIKQQKIEEKERREDERMKELEDTLDELNDTLQALSENEKKKKKKIYKLMVKDK